MSFCSAQVFFVTVSSCICGFQRFTSKGEQGLRRFPSARFCFPSCEVLEGEPVAPSEDFCALTMLVTAPSLCPVFSEAVARA